MNKVASGCFCPKVIIPLVPRASQHGPLRPPALKNFFESNFDFKGFDEVNRITARAETARGTSGIITYGEKDPEAPLLSLIVINIIYNREILTSNASNVASDRI